MPRRPKASRAPEKVAQTLDTIDLFAAASPAVRKSYEQRCLWQWWDRGSAILDRDAVSDDVYFVVAGEARILNYSASGRREVALDEVGSGGYFGEMAAIDGEPRSAAVTATARTLTARLPGRIFLDYLLSHPPAALVMMRRLTEMVRGTSARIFELSTLAAQSRIYGDLLRHAKTGGDRPKNSAVIAPVPRHHDIAARTGTTRETVARCLGELTRRSLLRRESGVLVIADVAALSRMVEEFRA
jgi:CRP/FNR family cyclic AMP-dependent transcriptional regulator